MRTRATDLKVWAALLAVMAAAMVVVALAVGTQPAKAAFPGSNGAIAFTSDQDGDLDIWRMPPTASTRPSLPRAPPTTTCPLGPPRAPRSPS